MFVLTEIKDLVTIHPKDSTLPLHISIPTELNKKYANKVLHKIGLCIKVYDVLSTEDAFIYHTDGLSYIKAHFRLIVFRPVIAEVLCGIAKSVSPSGIQVSLGFFDDIFVDPDHFRAGAEYSAENQSWEWDMDGTTIDIMAGDTIKVKVEGETFSESNPPPAKTSSLDQEIVYEEPKEAAYSLMCTIEDDGLGSTAWWE